MPDASSDKHSNEKMIELHELFLTALSYRYWIISLVITVTLLALVYSLKSEPKYQARGVLQIAISDKNFANVESSDELALTREDILNTLVETMKSPEVFKRMIQNHDLKLNNYASSGTEINPESDDTVQLKLQKALAELIQVKLRRGTRLVDVSVILSDPELAVQLVNGFAAAFLEYNAEKKMLRSQSANTGLLQESERLRERLKKSEEALQAFVESELDVNIVEQRVLVSSQLTRLNQSFNDTTEVIDQLESDLLNVRDLLNQNDFERLVEIPAIREDVAVKKARDEFLERQSDFESVQQRYKEKHPVYLDALAVLREAELKVNNLLESSPRWIESKLKNEQIKLKSLEEAIDKTQNDLLLVDNKAIEYNALNRQIETDRAVYENVLTRLKEMDVAKELEREFVTVEIEALEAQQVWPRPVLITALGFMGGTLLSAVGVFLICVTSQSLNTVDQAEHFLELPALGAIPARNKGTQGKKKKGVEIAGDRQVMVNDPKSICAESFRTLGATINMLNRSEKRQIVLFTSAVPGEGKSFCSTNYSFALAQQGEKTLLIDLDLRKPSIAKEFGLKNSHKGVSDYLIHDETLENLVIEKEGGKLHVLTAGPKLPNPLEQLNGHYINQLLTEVREKYDRIVLDTAPLNAVSDTLSILKHADVTCLVVRSGKTNKKVVKRPLEVMGRAGMKPSGFVLNFLPERPGYGSYYYYYYDQGYGSGKGVYGSEEDDD